MFLAVERPTMRKPSRIVVLSLLVSLLALGVAVYSAKGSTAEPPPSRPAVATSLSAGRFFVLLPDGRIEITDSWSRRTFRWDGHRWIQIESLSLPRPDSR
jgi:hypothetical protein